MKQTDLKPNRAIYLSVVKACGSLRAIEQGRLVHSQIIRGGLESDVMIGTVLTDMYIKCGSLCEAFRACKELQNPDAITWGSIVSGFASHGSSGLAWGCLENMQQCGFRPGDATFTSILTACGHAGLLGDGHQYFEMMREVHGVVPNIEHFGCMIDLFGRAGRLQEAEALQCTMPVCPDGTIWRSLLTSCKSYDNLELASECFNRACILYPDHASGYVLMSSMYAAGNSWEEVEHTETMKKWAGALYMLEREPG
jgi:pentatricopeptide repeat protein